MVVLHHLIQEMLICKVAEGELGGGSFGPQDLGSNQALQKVAAAPKP